MLSFFEFSKQPLLADLAAATWSSEPMRYQKSELKPEAVRPPSPDIHGFSTYLFLKSQVFLIRQKENDYR